MAKKQIKQYNEETAVTSNDLYVMQKSSNDQTVKVKASNIAPDGSITSTKLAESFFRGRYQTGAGVNSSFTGMTIQMGWGYIVGDGTNRIEKTVTFQTAFSAAPLVFVSFNASRSTGSGTPTGPDWFTTAIASSVATQAYSNSISTTSFQAVIQRSDADTLSSSNNYGFTWLAIGTI